ncbi:TPA: DUF6701 domain-containing protein [Vibrio alginolyticus]
MMRLCSIFTAVLFLPLTSHATTYDLADIKSNTNVAFCKNGTIHVTGSTYDCTTNIVLPKGDQIINSSQSSSSLTAHGSITLRGQNVIGSKESPINIKAKGTWLKINGNSYVLGNVSALGSIKITDSEIEGDIETNGVGGNGRSVEFHGEHNVLNGNIIAQSDVYIESGMFCGDIKSKGTKVEINQLESSLSNTPIVVGNINALSGINLNNTTVFGSLTSQGHTVDTGFGTTKIYANKQAISAMHFSINNSNTSICGSVTATLESSSNFNHYCGIDEPNCSYANQTPTTCPIPSYIPECKITPPSENDFDLSVTPSDDMALMCGDDLPQFTAMTTNNGEVVSAEVSAALSHPDLFTLEVIKGQQTLKANQFMSDDNGELVVRVVPNDIDTIALGTNYTLTFTMAEDTSKHQTVSFMFTPFMFEAYSKTKSATLNEIRVIAGKPENVHTRLLACASTGEPVVASNYNGTPKVFHPLVQPLGGSEGNFSYSAEFKDGLSEHGLVTNESGIFEVTLSDHFECEGFEECPEEGKVEVKGTFNVYSRPWTLAICDNQRALPSGTSEQGEGFLAAGELFSLTVKPIIWQPDGSVSGSVESARYCDASITRNFTLDDAPAASVVLSSEQHTPSETANQTSKLLKSSDSLAQAHNSAKNDQFVFNGLYWEEVGSLRVKANLESKYLGTTVNESYRYIGRFYPKYFQVQDQEWHYPHGQTFAYMNQPFEKVTYDVVALNAHKENVKNYVHFSSNLQQHFDLGELSSYSDRFLPPKPKKVDWKLLGSASVGTFVIEKPSTNATCNNSPCWKKNTTDKQYPDGPFNKGTNSDSSQIGLVTTKAVDEVNFFDDSEVLTKQPDIRFGRLNFQDVGGNQGMVIKVPLDVEIWQNGRFTTNFDDSSTTASGEYYFSTPIWSHALANNALLSGVGTMSIGRMTDIVASQIDSAREQIQFHLDLDGSGNRIPWLKYDWDNTTSEEENPPVTVTFGVHRGNDRIIYRGEPNMLGLN